jgi:hypothetical protein
MPRYDQILRQWRVLLALSHRQWFTVNEVRDSIPKPRPHRRTIMRDLEVLEKVFPIQKRHWKSRNGLAELQYRLRYPLNMMLRPRQSRRRLTIRPARSLR